MALAGAIIGLTSAGFMLLYLSVPAGLTTPYAHAPDIGRVYAAWPLPRLHVDAKGFSTMARLLLAAMWIGYLLSWWLASRARPGQERPLLRVVGFGVVALHALLILTPPTLSKDLYHYALFGRMLVSHGLNPYLNAGQVLEGDALLPLASWSFLPTHYGPTFTLLSAAAALAGNGHPVATAIAFKVLAAVGSVTVAWCIFALASREGRPAAPAVLCFGWSPLTLVETAGNGHNDTVMVALALLGLVAMQRQRLVLATALVVLSVHVKWLTLVVLGLMALERLRTPVDGRAQAARLRTLAVMAGVTLGLSLLLYLPFWSGIAAFRGTSQLLTHAESMPAVGVKLSPLRLGLFAGISLTAAVMVWRDGWSRLHGMAAAAVLAFVVFVFPWRFPWYLLPPLAFLCAGPPTNVNRSLLLATVLIAALLMVRWTQLLPGVPAT